MNTSLLFGIHCHQPIDNFDYVLENAIEKSYKPFFKVLQEFPHFKCSVHFSGWLLEFIEKNDEELFELMVSLSSQIEFFTGGFYEPILASIPSNDRIAQIKKLNNYIKKHFNQTPKGLWLTERVWDDTIIKDLSLCGIKYVIVDDYHIKVNGYNSDNLNGYFVTEENGEKIAIFPINKTLRYDIPFANNNELNDTIHTFENANGKNAAIIFDDGEKFGIWPKTYERVYEKEWLREFFKNCCEDEKIIVETFHEYYSREKPISLVYLPTVSYEEMGEWSLKADDIIKIEELHKSLGSKEFFKGGIWKNFLIKYQESNWIHKRVLELSKKQINKKIYTESLYKAQCNDVLWHGVFGGIYLPNLRDNAYKYIIMCENYLQDNNTKGYDIDYNGYLEYKFQTENVLTIISPKNGAQIFELDLKDKFFNLQNTLTRYKEAYHEKIQIKEPSLEDEPDEFQSDSQTIHDNILSVDQYISLDYDWYLKKSAIEHICEKDLTIEKFKACSFTEFSDFANQDFEVIKKNKNSIVCKRDGGLYLDKKYETTLTKSFKFEDDTISFVSNIQSEYENENELSYLHEYNLHFMNIKNITINKEILEDTLTFQGKYLEIEDKILDKTIRFTFANDVTIFICKIDTISQSESGVDVTTQGVSFGFSTPLIKELTFSYTLQIL
jgi:alpha-amylase/alpha-mannosidase (GH57 family)